MSQCITAVFRPLTGVFNTKGNTITHRAIVSLESTTTGGGSSNSGVLLKKKITEPAAIKNVLASGELAKAVFCLQPDTTATKKRKSSVDEDIIVGNGSSSTFGLLNCSDRQAPGIDIVSRSNNLPFVHHSNDQKMAEEFWFEVFAAALRKRTDILKSETGTPSASANFVAACDETQAASRAMPWDVRWLNSLVDCTPGCYVDLGCFMEGTSKVWRASPLKHAGVFGPSGADRHPAAAEHIVPHLHRFLQASTNDLHEGLHLRGWNGETTTPPHDPVLSTVFSGETRVITQFIREQIANYVFEQAQHMVAVPAKGTAKPILVDRPPNADGPRKVHYLDLDLFEESGSATPVEHNVFVDTALRSKSLLKQALTVTSINGTKEGKKPSTSTTDEVDFAFPLSRDEFTKESQQHKVTKVLECLPARHYDIVSVTMSQSDLELLKFEKEKEAKGGEQKRTSGKASKGAEELQQQRAAAFSNVIRNLTLMLSRVAPDGTFILNVVKPFTLTSNNSQEKKLADVRHVLNTLTGLASGRRVRVARKIVPGVECGDGHGQLVSYVLVVE